MTKELPALPALISQLFQPSASSKDLVTDAIKRLKPETYEAVAADLKSREANLAERVQAMKAQLVLREKELVKLQHKLRVIRGLIEGIQERKEEG